MTNQPLSKIIEVGNTRHRSGTAWQFFYEIADVTNLGPGEEQGEMWEVIIPEDTTTPVHTDIPDDRVIGMAVVDTIPSKPFVFRVGVLENFRENGIGSALLEKIRDSHGDIACRVKEGNTAGEALVRSNGFHQVESRFTDLNRYETNPSSENKQAISHE